MAKMRSVLTSVTLTALVSSVKAHWVNETQYVRQAQQNNKNKLECVVMFKVPLQPPGVDTTNVDSASWDCQLFKSTPAANGMSGKLCSLEELDDVIIQDAEDSTVTINLTEYDSASSILTIEGAKINPNCKIKLKGAKVTINKNKKDKPKNGINSGNYGNGSNEAVSANLSDYGYSNNSTRRLQRLGRRRVLAVRVNALDSTNSIAASVLGNKIFGTNGDLHNLATGYKACSYDKLIFEPVRTLQSTTLSIPGVYEVTISINVNGVNDAIKSDRHVVP